MSDYFNMEYLKSGSIEKREYQEYLFKNSKDESSVVVLPTGTGKTVVSLLISCHRLGSVDDSKVLFLAPTKPLVNQQAEFYSENMDIDSDKVQVFTGETSPDNREDLWELGDWEVLFATPQVIENDLIANRISFEDISHMVFDECHKARGDYSYNYIAERYDETSRDGLITGLSASPGSDKEDIVKVCKNLKVTNIEIVTEDMDMLSKYDYDTSIDPVWVNVDDEILEIRDLVQSVLKDRKEKLKSRGALSSSRKNMPKSELLQANRELINSSDKDYKSISYISEALKLHHALTLIESQGVDSFLSYYNDMVEDSKSEDSSKAVGRIVKNKKINEAVSIARDYDDYHAKKTMLRGDLINHIVNDGQCIVFTNYRDTANNLVEFLNDVSVINAHKFVGQSDKNGRSGLSQARQKKILEDFRDGEYNVLVSTSVGEEGLDIPQVDLIIFYEPISSGIRRIQRQGRTGRQSKGEVKIYIGEDTNDESMYFASKNSMDKLESDLKELKDMELDIEKEISSTQSEISNFEEGSEKSYKIICDQRETSSSVVRNLDRMDNCVTKLETLEVGDYVLSNKLAVERKSMSDFIDTLTGSDGRSLFEQSKNLVQSYDNAIIIMEGNLDELYSRDVHDNAIIGSMASIVSDFGISFMFSRNEMETSKILSQIAEKEQVEKDRSISIHNKKDTATLSQQQKYIVSSIEDVGAVTAENLLEEFGSVIDIFNAEVEDLQNVENIGKKTAENIYRILREDY
jgi:Fanconi anemia group M protein